MLLKGSSMGIIGRYNLLLSVDGQYAVEWYYNNKHYLVRLPNFVNQLDEMVKKEISIRKHFADVFHLAFSENTDNFINHPDFVIMDHLNTDETTPNKELDQKELFKFNIKKLLLAYNRWKGTALKYSEVEPLCLPNLKKNHGNENQKAVASPSAKLV